MEIAEILKENGATTSNSKNEQLKKMKGKQKARETLQMYTEKFLPTSSCEKQIKFEPVDWIFGFLLLYIFTNDQHLI